MKTIWKFTLQPECEIEMPSGAQILSVHEQRGEVCLWALVDDAARNVRRSFLAIATGEKVPPVALTFIGTVHLEADAMVFHVFEVGVARG